MAHDHAAHAFHLLHAIDPLTLAGFFSMFAYSFFASLHCAAMCAPLVGAKLGDRAKPSRSGIWAYNLGRGLAYILGGVILGALGSLTARISPVLQQGLAIGLGVMLIAFALLMALGKRGLFNSVVIGPLLKSASRLVKPLRKLTPTAQDFGLGLITILLPCMSLSPALAAAAASGTAYGGALLMMAFYLGTLPVMIFAPSVPSFLGERLPRRAAQIFAVLFLFLAGVVTLLRAFH